MEKNRLKEIIADAIARPLDHIRSRAIDIPLDVDKIISLIGHRRSGKTSICYYLIKRLRQTLQPHRIVYINFEDDRLFPFHLSDMSLLLEAYYEMFPDNKSSKVYFFLDEIQEVENWEKFVRRLYDNENCRIYLTGSSSSLLSREIASTLRGRTLTYEIYPLSFGEFLNFKGIDRNFSSKASAYIRNAFDLYFEQGGFPELLYLPHDLHRRTIKEYIDLMLFRDIAERFEIRNTYLLKYLLKYLLQNVGNLLSVNKVYNDLRSQGFKISKSTVYEYILHFEEAFALFRVQRWSASARQQAVNPNKIYCIDHAYKYEMSMGEDAGRILENIVFVHLMRKGIKLNYFNEKREVDFYVEKEMLINVALEMDDAETRKRELSGLLMAMKYFDLNEGQILTRDHSETIKDGVNTIYIRPVTEFLLEID